MSRARKFSRTLPYVRILHKSNPRGPSKIQILKRYPTYVADDISELLHNILIGKLKVSSKQKAVLAKHRLKMHKFADLPTSQKKRRDFIYKQKGGFLSAILPIIASVLGGLIN